jgi:hypothetical protein
LDQRKKEEIGLQKYMKPRFIVDGNIAGWGQWLLIVLGGAMILFGLSVQWIPRALAISLFILGLPVAAIGGYAGRAKALGIKPFDNSYKKARDSYKTKDDENGK